MMKIKNLYGLVLTGGKSSRMGEDKASIEYHGKKQSAYCFELLSQFCEQTFISNRAEQTTLPGQKEFPQIHDRKPFLNIGPLGGILSAINQYPKNDWLVLGCDLPFVNESTIQYLIAHRNSPKAATAFISTHDELPEPLCAIYEAHAHSQILEQFEKGKTCPRKYLINTNVELLKQPDALALENINTQDELAQALKNIKTHGK